MNLTLKAQNGYNVRKLAKSSPSNWRYYTQVTRARHTLSVISAFFVSAVSLMVDCMEDLCPLHLEVVRQSIQSATLIGVGAVGFQNLLKETAHV